VFTTEFEDPLYRREGKKKTKAPSVKNNRDIVHLLCHKASFVTMFIDRLHVRVITTIKISAFEFTVVFGRIFYLQVFADCVMVTSSSSWTVPEQKMSDESSIERSVD